MAFFFLTRSAQMWPRKLRPFCGNLEIFSEKDMKQKFKRIKKKTNDGFDEFGVEIVDL